MLWPKVALWPSTQAFEAGASETRAIAVAPSAYTLSEYLASYTAQLPSGPTAYYINDRFLLSVPEELVESLVSLYANATSPHAVLLIQPGSRSVGVNNNSDTAFGYRDAWTVWVWPFWLRSDGGAAVDGRPTFLDLQTLLRCYLMHLLPLCVCVSLLQAALVDEVQRDQVMLPRVNASCIPTTLFSSGALCN